MIPDRRPSTVYRTARWAVGGVAKADVPRIVANLLRAREHELEFTIRPERAGFGYTIAWTTLCFDNEAREWIPLYDRSAEDAGDG